MGEIALSVRGLGRNGEFRDVGFDVRKGEVLGITGLMGAGRTELVSAIFGLAPADTGEIRIGGAPVAIRCPADAIRRGIGMVTEDRKAFGLTPTMSVKHNMTLASLDACCIGPFLRHAKENAIVDAGIRAFAIKAAGRGQAVVQLSGGNQQKVVISRSLLAEPSIVILDEPTRGIDVGAKNEVYALIARLAEQGKAIILVSSELPEVLALSDRLLVMRQGELAAELDPSRTSQEEVLRNAMPL
jgi:ABC-type sugar transport system ATPase subunit